MTSKITFLCFAFKGAIIRWSGKKFAEFKRRARKLTSRSWGVSMANRFSKLANIYVAGWAASESWNIPVRQ